MLSPCFFVVHDASTCGEHDVSELTRGKKFYNPLLKITELDVVAWADAASLVDAAVQLDHDFAIAVIVNFLELADVAVLLHNREELDNDLRARSNEDLTLSRFFGIVDGVEAIIEYRGSNHCDGYARFSMAMMRLRYLWRQVR